MKALVIPSNSKRRLENFFAAWRPVADWDVAIVVFDACCPPAIDGADEVYAWHDIDRELGDAAWIISRRNAGIRTFGFLRAYQMGAEVIATLDDDCLPGDPLFESHVRNLTETTCWTSSSLNITARGMPYRNRGHLLDVAVNVGLWRNVADWDAPHTLVTRADSEWFEPVAFDRMIPAGQYVPMSTMNLAFARMALPAFYLPRMGQGVEYDRFDDIWGGVIVKRICDHLGCHVTVGRPVVEHQRASDPFTNLVKEANGIARNETFWQDIHAMQLRGSDFRECMAEIGNHLLREKNAFGAYFQQLGQAILLWLELLNT